LNKQNTHRPSRAVSLTLGFTALTLLVAGALLVTGGKQSARSQICEKNVAERNGTDFTRRPAPKFPIHPAPTQTGEKTPGKGDKAPDFRLPTINGGEIKLSDYRGKVVMLDFWSVTCGPCIQATSHLEGLYRKYKDKGFVVIGINLDTYPEMIKKFVERARLTYPIVKADNRVIDDYGGIITIPQSFLVDKNGKIYKHYNGFGMAYVYRMEKDVRRLLEIE